MSSLKIEGNNLPNLPWQDRPAGCKDPLWRYSENPVIPRDLLPDSNSIFNSAVIPFEGGFAGVFRCDDKNRRMTLHAAFSKDGFNWEINPETIKFEGADPEIGEWVYGYDPRVAKIEDKYYVTWCNGYHGPTIGMAWPTDFKTFHQMENAFLPYNRNGVLFPRKINGKYALLDYFAVKKDLRGTGIGSKTFPLLRTEMKDRDGLLLEVESVESAEAEEEVNIRRRRIAFYERCGCEMTKAKSLLYGVDFNILVLPIAQPVPEAKVVLHELENIYHVMFDDELYRRVCHPFIAE